jgi:hypothetical protein
MRCGTTAVTVCEAQIDPVKVGHYWEGRKYLLRGFNNMGYLHRVLGYTTLSIRFAFPVFHVFVSLLFIASLSKF